MVNRIRARLFGAALFLHNILNQESSMTLRYGFYKAKLNGAPRMQKMSITQQHETQYHMHISLSAPGDQPWDCAINVGPDDQDDLLRYRMVTDFVHPICALLQDAAEGYNDQTGAKSCRRSTSCGRIS